MTVLCILSTVLTGNLGCLPGISKGHNGVLPRSSPERSLRQGEAEGRLLSRVDHLAATQPSKRHIIEWSQSRRVSWSLLLRVALDVSWLDYELSKEAPQ